MDSSTRHTLREKSYGDILILWILVRVIRLVSDLPAFFCFLATGKAPAKRHLH